MTFYERINKKEKEDQEIIKDLAKTEFLKSLTRLASLEKYDLFKELVGMELRPTNAHGPIYLKRVLIPHCYNDKKDLKKNIIRLVLDISYWDEENEYNIEDQHKVMYDVWLDIPSTLLESWTLKKMKKWAQDQTNYNRSSLVKFLNEEIQGIKKRLDKLNT